MIPLTVIGGYLGAGKTTLINHLLAGEHSRQLGVLINDFGDINIDVDLIAQHDGETLALTNGCVCCSIRDDLGAALESLRLKKIDHVLIEASGVAQPAKIADYGLTWPGYELAGTVVLVNARALRTQLRDKYVGELVAAQLHHADLLVVTLDSDLPSADRDDMLGALPRPFTGFDQIVAEPEVLFGLRHSAAEEAATPVVTAFTSHVVELPSSVHTALIEELFELAPRELARAKGWFTDQHNARWQIDYAGGELRRQTTTTNGANRLVFIYSAERAAAPFDRALNKLMT